MVTKEGILKVMDFGIASSLSDSMSKHSRVGQQPGGSGGGTLPYMSPQQLMGYPPSVADDVYALGATIYELLTGKPPFFRGGEAGIFRQIETQMPPSMTERRAELGVEQAAAIQAVWEAVVAACLEKEAEKRPRSVAEVWQRLNGGSVGQTPVREPASAAVSNPSSPIADQSYSTTRSRKPLLLALSALLCVGGVLGWWYGYEQPRQERERLAQEARLEQQRVEAENLRLAEVKAAAEEQARQAAAKRTMEVAALVTDGRKAYGAEDYTTARAKLEAALVLEPQHAEATRLLDQVKSGEAKRQQEQMAAAELARKKSEAAALVSEARTLFNGKDYDGAKQKISAALYLVPGDSAAVGLRGEVEAAMTAKTPVNATKEQPFTNSLGMKFVAVPGTQVLMCVHETRNADYAAYAAAQSGVDEEWKEEAGSGKEQHPVVNVSDEDAEGFCRWLSAKEGKTYRLPTDAEWSAAVGLGKETGRTPEEKDENGPENEFPWGDYYPPKPGDGNYDPSVVDDGYEQTAPVMSFRANRLGLYDLGGNVYEWCQDWYDDSRLYRVLRGASWNFSTEANLRSSYRICVFLRSRVVIYGFRCVLVVAGG
jgi:formylglycine-generating enzyme required for sulfatase activity